MTIIALKFSLIEIKEHFLHPKWTLSRKCMRTSAIKPPNVTLVRVFNSQEDKVFACFFLGDKKKTFQNVLCWAFPFQNGPVGGNYAIGLLIVK